MQHVIVRPAGAPDMAAVARIYAAYVVGSVATFDTEPPSAAQWEQRREQIADRGWPFLAAVVDDEVVGYAYVAPWRDRPAYGHTVEDSVYLDPVHRGHGYGRALLDALLPAAAAAGARQVIAVIADQDDVASLALHAAVGFRPAGRLSAVGYKHGRWIDVVLLQATLSTV